MKVTIYEVEGKEKTDKVITELEINEIKFPQRRALHVLNNRRFEALIGKKETGKAGFKASINLDHEAFGVFYAKVFELSGIKDEVLMAFDDDIVDVILEQIYEAWQPDEKKS